MERTTDKPIRLHVGSGRHYWPGFTNVDSNSDADVMSDVRKLDFKTDSVSEIHAIHVVEHVPRLDIESMLFEWHRVLKPGGKVCIEVPCMNKIAQNIVNGEKNMRLTLLGIFGDPRDPLPDMMHQWCYTKEELHDILDRTGFTSIQIMEPDFHMQERDMRIEACTPC